MAASFFKSRERASSTIDAMPCYYKQELLFGIHLNHKISPGKWEKASVEEKGSTFSRSS